MKVILAGTGCGSPGNMTAEVKEALMEADLIIGARRLLDGLDEQSRGEKKPAIYAVEIRDMIREAEEGGVQKVCVAFSGDSGFYSGTRNLLPLLGEEGIEAEVLPGISSIQVFSSRLQRPWQDWELVSAHGARLDAVSAVMRGKPVFFLTGGKLTPAELCRDLSLAGLGQLKVWVGERLTYEDERILQGRAADFAERKFAPLSVMLAEPADWAGDLTPGIGDDEFIRGEVPMTKQTVRAAILAQMKVRERDTVWDVGAGTGSVSVELAMKARSGRVYAIERKGEASSLIRQNRGKFGVWNLCPVDGTAPEALTDLPAPDRVFVGGSDGRLREIIGTALEKNPAARICVSAIVLETLHEAVEVMTGAGLDAEIVQVSVSTARKAGNRHMMTAGNPIFIITGEKHD